MKYEDNIQKIVNSYFSRERILRYYKKPRFHLDERSIFRKFLKKSGRVLDLFCGAGRVSIPLARQGYEVVGIDINKKLIKMACSTSQKLKLDNVKFYCMDAVKMKFKKEFFDYVIILENGLEHVPGKSKRRTIMKKTYKVLKKDGILILTFHSYFYGFSRIGLKFPFQFFRVFFPSIKNIILGINETNDWVIVDMHYYHLFPPWEIKHLLKRSGFKNKPVIIPCNVFHNKKNKFKNKDIYKKILWPFTYNFWVVKK